MKINRRSLFQLLAGFSVFPLAWPEKKYDAVIRDNKIVSCSERAGIAFAKQKAEMALKMMTDLEKGFLGIE